MNPDVELVMMSKASTPQLASITQNAIDTALKGAGEHNLKVIVMEQSADFGTFRGALTVPMREPFNYNAFANRAIECGSAPWIVVANNDLVFHKGWLDALLAANHPVMSPVSPGYHRHRNVLHNERGWEVGRHFAGWCFMLKRDVWKQIGGFDETYPFWCADNMVVNQLRAHGYQPMLVCDSIVHHLLSATLSREDREVQDDLTWAQLHKYNHATGAWHLAGDRRYITWKLRNGIKT